MERSFHLLEKEGVQFPDAALGYVLFRQAASTDSQELPFAASAQGKYDKKTMISCLRKLEKVIADQGTRGKSSMALLETDGTDAFNPCGDDDVSISREMDEIDVDE